MPQVGPLARIIPAICNAEAGRRNTPKRKAIRTSQKVHRQRRNTPTTRTAISTESAIRKDASVARRFRSNRAGDGQKSGDREVHDLDPALVSEAKQADRVATDVEAASRKDLGHGKDVEEGTGRDAANEKRLGDSRRSSLPLSLGSALRVSVATAIHQS